MNRVKDIGIRVFCVFADDMGLMIAGPEFTATFLNHRRDVNPWSALRAEFSRNENRRDGFPEPRTGVGMKRKGLRLQPGYIRR